MHTKLTLHMDKEIIEAAKKYARRHKISLSKLIENYLRALVRPGEAEIQSGSLTDDLTGVIKEPPADYKDEYSRFLQKKYR